MSDEKENEVDIEKIENVEQLKEAYSILIEQYKEVIKATPGVAQEAIKRGYKEKVNAIGQKFEEIKQSIRDGVNNLKIDMSEIGKIGLGNEMGIARDAVSRNSQTQQWQNAHSDRDSGVTNTVGAIDRGATKVKSIVALGTIKLSTLGAKGARLIGAKNISERIIQKGNTYARALLTKDSRIGEFAKSMAENGFIEEDQVKATIEYAKEMIAAYGSVAIDMSKNAVKKGKDTVVDFGTKTVETAKAVGTKTAETAKAVGTKTVETAKAVGTKTVETAKAVGTKTAETAKAVGTKTVETAKAVGTKTAETAKAVGTKTVETAKAVGTKTAETAKAVGIKTAETAKAVGTKTVETAKAVGTKTVETAKKGTIAVGKVAVIPAAAIGAIGSLSLDVAKTGISAIEDKVTDAKETVQNYTEIAKAKSQNVKDNIKVGFFSKVSSFLDSMKRKIDSSLIESKENQQKSNDRLQDAKSKISSQKENEESERE